MHTNIYTPMYILVVSLTFAHRELVEQPQWYRQTVAVLAVAPVVLQARRAQ
jgi:hypothetical protein